MIKLLPLLLLVGCSGVQSVVSATPKCSVTCTDCTAKKIEMKCDDTQVSEAGEFEIGIDND